MFAALGRFAYRHRWAVLAVWAAAFAAALAASTRLSGELKGSAYVDPDTSSQVALSLLHQRLGVGTARITVVFTSDTLRADSPEFQRQQEQALAGITKEAFPTLASIEEYSTTADPTFFSRDGKASIAWLVFNERTDQLEKRVPAVTAALHPTALRTYVTGEAAYVRDLETISASDIRRAESVLFPIALLLLLLIFGTVFAALLPIAGGGAAVAVTLGVLALLAPYRDVSAFAVSIAALLGLGEGIVYSLLIVSRFREELARGRPVPDAVVATMTRAGWAVLVSGTTVVVCLMGLVSFEYTSLNSVGVGGAIVVGFSVLAALTLQPALLGLLGERVNTWRVLWRPGREGRLLRRWAHLVTAHAGATTVVAVVFVVLLASPIVAIDLAVPNAGSLPAGTESRLGDEIYRTRFNAPALDPIQLLVTWDDSSRDPFAAANLVEENAFGLRLLHSNGVAGVISIADIPVPGGVPTLQNFWPQVLTGKPPAQVAQGGMTPAQVVALLTPLQKLAALKLAHSTAAPGAMLYRVQPDGAPDSPQAQQLALRLRHVTPPPGAHIWVTGTAEGVRDYLASLTSATPLIGVFVALASGLLLGFFLRAPLAALLSVVASGLSLLASFGALVWIFQMGHLEWLLRFRSVGAVDGDTIVVLFCIVFGVSMDYQVFLLARVREEWPRGTGGDGGEGGGDGRTAVAAALAATGRVILPSALILIVAAGSFIFSGVIVTKAIGVGLAVALVIDALVVRMTLVPATIGLLGRLVWWPAREPAEPVDPYAEPGRDDARLPLTDAAG